MKSLETWVEVSRSSLKQNFETLNSLCEPKTTLAPVVKANAYGHGLRLCAETFVSAGASTLCVNELQEVSIIQDLQARVLVVGPIFDHQADHVASLGCDVTVNNEKVLHALNQAAIRANTRVSVHMKVDTGTNRQGFTPAVVPALIQRINAMDGIQLVGISTHLADVEDETTHTFAQVQLQRFADVCADISEIERHCASSAVHLLFAEARLDLVRAGIACYGLWPSKETKIATDIVHQSTLSLSPALCWKTRIAQLRMANVGDYVGYGRTHRCPQDTRIAVLPVGYYDGYDRRLSSKAHVLVSGQRAPVLGRVCMNMIMVDVSNLSDVAVGDEVVLLGQQGDECVSAQQLADWMDSIHYEVTTRIHERIPRISVD